MYRLLQMHASHLEEEMVSFAQKLVQTPSTSLNEANAAKMIENKMTQLGYDLVTRDNAGNVVGVILGRSSDVVVVLNSHIDTVSVSDESQWNHKPFEGIIKDGILYGCGAADCKSGIAAQIYAGALLKRSLLPLEGTLVVAATTAEENGLSLGVKTLLSETLPELKLKPTYAILGEPTTLGLYYGHDGWLDLDIRVSGMNPFHVDDAVQDIMNDLYNGKHNTSEIEICEPSFGSSDGNRNATIRVTRRLHEAENVNDVVAQVGRLASLIGQPSGAVAVDVAIAQEEQKLYTGSVKAVRKIADAWSTDPFSKLVDRARHALTAAGCNVVAGKWKLSRLRMGTAGNVFVNEFNIPTIGYGPGNEEQAHAVNESVVVDKIARASYGTAAIVHSCIGVPVFGWSSDDDI
ncbi:MAG: M20/M25/M40 family metallo-hydrolase [Candidatus Auribacterota bacterium]